MLRVILEGWSEDGDEQALRRAIQDATGLKVPKAHLRRLKDGGTVIIEVSPEHLPTLMHRCLRCGVETADMFVGSVSG